MAKVSLAIIPNRPNRHGECVVMLQISAHLKTIRTPTEVTVLKQNWIQKEGLVLGGKNGDKLASSKNVRLTQIKNGCDVKMINNQARVDKMDVNTLKNFLLSEDDVANIDFFTYARQKIKDYKDNGQEKTAGLFTCTINKMIEFWGDSSLDFDEITSKFLQKFESYCLTTPIKSTAKNKEKVKVKYMSQNGVAGYLRNIRTIFNDAIENDSTEKYPFKKFKITTVKTKNRNLPIETIRLFRDYTPANKREEIARDFVMMQLYLSAINAADLWEMDTKEMVDGRLQFYRRKTIRFWRYHNIKIEPEALFFLNKYKGEKHLLWFKDSSEREPGAKKYSRASEFQYKDEPTFLKMINRGIASIQKALNVHPNVKITDYWIRHSLATILRTDVTIDGARIGTSDVAQILGHKEVEHMITGTYINEDYSGNDKIMRSFIDYLNEDINPKKSKRSKKQPPAIS